MIVSFCEACDIGKASIDSIFTVELDMIPVVGQEISVKRSLLSNYYIDDVSLDELFNDVNGRFIAQVIKVVFNIEEASDEHSVDIFVQFQNPK